MVVQAGMFIDESLGEMEEVGRRLPRAGALARSADVRTVAPIGSEPFGTPIVESWRAAIRHLLRLALRGRIEEEGE